MKSTLMVTLVVAVAALAGCTDKGDSTPALTEEDCAALGLVLGTIETMDEPQGIAEGEPNGGDDSMDDEPMDDSNETGGLSLSRQAEENGTVDDGMDDGSEHDHLSHSEEHACVPAGPPATLTIEDLPAATAAYSTLTFRWILNTETEDEMHTMDTRVMFETGARTSTASDDDLGKPETYGEEVAKMEHQNFFDGQSYEASFTPTEAGTVYFRAFALVNGENIWSPEYVLEVGPVEPTGTTHTITCSNGGMPVVSSCDESPLSITLGDAVEWANGNPGSLGGWTIASTNEPDNAEAFSTTAGGDSVLFVVPGSYSYSATGDAGSVSGTIEVAAPAA